MGLWSCCAAAACCHPTAQPCHGCATPCPAQAVHINLEDNQLTGPAFPAAWLERGAMPNLSSLMLSSNRLSGSLPPHLSWPNLAQL